MKATMSTTATRPRRPARPTRRGIPVRFELNSVPARSIRIAGTFNNWHPEATDMIDLGDGRWVKELVLHPGTYEYLLVVDGQWVLDPSALEFIANPFGGRNCVIRVAERAPAKRATAPGGRK